MRTHKLAIKRPPGKDSVKLDGRDITDALRGLTLKVDPDMNEATLDIQAFEFEFEGEVKVMLFDSARDLLVRLGWTPPNEG